MPRRLITNASVSFTTEIILSECPKLVEAHLKNVANTVEIEQLGQQVLESNFDWILLEKLIRKVCKWGGFAGIAGRIVINNPPGHIKTCFSVAREFMDLEKPQLNEALREINKIKDLGTPSFASKHL